MFRGTRGLLAVSVVLCALAGCAANSRAPRAKAPKGDPGPKKAELFPEASEDQIRSFAHYAAGLSLDMRDDSASALEEYVQAAEANPAEEGLVLDVARRLLRAKQNDRAIALLAKSSAHPASTGLSDSWLGLAYAAAGETNKAVQSNRKAIQKLPGQISAYANLCELYLQLGKTNEVAQVVSDAGKQTGAPADFYVNLSEVVLRMQAKDVFGPAESKKHALNALDKAAALAPSDPVLRQRMGDAYLFHGEPGKAEGIFERLFAERPELPGVREKLINVYFRTNKEKATAMLNNLRKEAPTDPRPHLFLGQLALDGDRMPEALEHFETALRLNPNDESLWHRVAALKVAVKKPGDALHLLEQARAKFKLSFSLEFYTGIALAAMERYSDALSRFTSAELLAKTGEPERLTAQFYFQLGSASERAKDIGQAVKYFRRALELEPDFAEALNYLGYMWAVRGENLEEAQALIERALKEEPKNAAFLDSMAWVLFKQNKAAAALDYMRQAIELNKEPDPTLFDHLGDILAALKKPAEAREAWEKALQLEPKDEIRKKLEAGS